VFAAPHARILNREIPVEMMLVLYLLLIVVIIVGMWKVFEKAGEPGWAAIVPFYNVYVLTCKIAQKEILWFILFFIPIVNIIAAIVVSIEVAQKFGKGAGFGIGLALLGFIFYPILGFGPAQYMGGRGRRGEYDDYEEGEEDDPKRKRKGGRDW
jgi:Family of unknown function (DUF5684)